MNDSIKTELEMLYSKQAKLKMIKDVAKKINIKSDDLIPYGKYMAKIPILDKPYGKLILVTSTNPTPYGEGKTTLAVGLNDALNKNVIRQLLL